MGWDETMYYKKLSHKERREEMDKRFTWENKQYNEYPLASTIKNNVYYGAIKRTYKDGTIEVWCAICPLSVRKEGIEYWYGTKLMCESMGVNGCYDCPKKILDLLTPTDNEWANEWRAKCIEHAGKPNLSKLEVGTVIEFVCPFDTTAWSAGETVRLEKICRTVNWVTGRKSYSWVGNGWKWSQKMIPADFKVVSV